MHAGHRDEAATISHATKQPGLQHRGQKQHPFTVRQQLLDFRRLCSCSASTTPSGVTRFCSYILRIRTHLSGRYTRVNSASN